MEEEHSSVTLFREYLRIKTVQPNINYDDAVAFLKRVSEDIGLKFKTVEVQANKPICIMTWEGVEPKLPSLVLSSHIDVVPVFPEHWKVDPFSADKIDGNIYARGAQDMKCVTIQYLEAVRRLKEAGRRFRRTIHMICTSDEEIGSVPQSLFVKHDEFKRLNVGFALDEGIANPGEEFKAFYGERSFWWVKIICRGNPGHGSQFICDTATEKMQKIVNSFLSYRDKEEARLNSDENLSIGSVTTVNMTMMSGGIQYNVIPSELELVFDIRLPPDVNLDKFEEQINRWCQYCNVSYEFIVRGDHQELTSISESDKWWKAFSGACNKLNLTIKPQISPVGTDSRFTRKCGIPAIGFSPMNKTPILLHDHNEYLNEEIFLKGIEIYEELIPSLANVN